MQGLIPYGAQLLIAASFTNGLVSPVQIVPYIWYCMILAVFATLSIFTSFGNRYLIKNPWNFEEDTPMDEVASE
jgi:Na+/H+ antiporter NhaC